MLKQENQKVSLAEKLVYGSGQLGLGALFTLFSSYVLYFYTDAIGMNAAIVGTIILVSKLFDGISDIVAGQLVDTHVEKKGHCIPVMVKWIVPMVFSLLLVFLVPNSSLAVRIAYIFITYNLFNSVLYTYVSVAYTALPSYTTSDPVARSQMCCYSMLFGAFIQTVMASVTLPLVEFFGGQGTQSAWVKTVLIFGVICIIIAILNAVVVKERVENSTPPENIVQSLKIAFKNKYWIMTVFFTICCNLLLIFNLSVSVYYLNCVVGNLGLMGAYVAVCNVPGVILMMIIPSFLNKISKRTLIMIGTLMMLVGHILFILGPTDSATWLLGTGLIRGIGFSAPMGLYTALIADTVDYGEWKTGVKIQGMLFSANSVGQKIGQGLMTSLFGLFLSTVGYDGLLEVQSAHTISGIEMFFKYVPLLVYVALLIITYLFKLEKELPQIQKDLEERRARAEA